MVGVNIEYIHYSYAYKTGRTVERDLMGESKMSTLCTVTIIRPIYTNTFPFKRCSPGRHHPSIISRRFASSQEQHSSQPPTPHNKCARRIQGVEVVVWSKKGRRQSSNLSVCTLWMRNIVFGSAKLRTEANTGVKETHEGFFWRMRERRIGLRVRSG